MERRLLTAAEYHRRSSSSMRYAIDLFQNIICSLKWEEMKKRTKIQSGRCFAQAFRGDSRRYRSKITSFLVNTSILVFQKPKQLFMRGGSSTSPCIHAHIFISTRLPTIHSAMSPSRYLETTILRGTARSFNLHNMNHFI